MNLFYGDNSMTPHIAPYYRMLFDSVVKLIPTGRKVLFFTEDQPFSYFATSPLVNADLHTLGSQLGIAQIATWGSFAMIGRKVALRGPLVKK